MKVPPNHTAPSGDFRTIYAWVWPDGSVQLGAYLPDGAPEICRGTLYEMKGVFRNDRHSSAMAEAVTIEEKAQALQWLRAGAEQRLGRPAMAPNF
jgi:hypothetical protein